MKRLFVLSIVVCLLSTISYSQRPTAFRGCPAEGRGKSGTLSQFFVTLNLFKNRDQPPPRIDRSITLTEILKPANNDKFTNFQGAEITGYVAYVYWGELGESSNCSRRDLADVHIAIVCNPLTVMTKLGGCSLRSPRVFNSNWGTATLFKISKDSG